MLTKDNFSGTTLSPTLVNTVTIPITVNSGDDRFMYVLVASQTAPTGVSYNGVAMTNYLNESFGASLTHSTWTLSSPDTGTNNLKVTHSSPAISEQVNVQSFRNCRGIGNTVLRSGTTLPATGTLTINSASILIADGDGQVSNAGAGICNPLLWNNQINGVWAGGGLSTNLAGSSHSVVFSGTLNGISPAGLRVWEIQSTTDAVGIIRI
jgi:hypothetical protein